MIGYVTPHRPDLKVKELATYNAYYCGLCRSLGTGYGCLMRNTLNNESVFLAVFLDSALRDGPVHEDFQTFRCLMNPLKKKQRIRHNPYLAYTADVNVFVAYNKLKDNVRDEKNILSWAGTVLSGHAYRKACQNLGDLSGSCLRHLDRLNRLEKDLCRESMLLAECYGQFTRDVFSSQFQNDRKTFQIAGEIGYNIGKWIYLLDGFDDMEKDIRKNAYNPLVLEHRRCGTESIDALKKRVAPLIYDDLLGLLGQAVKAFDLMDIRRNEGLLLNIFYEGLFHRTRMILDGDGKNGERPL
ncbi:MAG: DUF5685 family protein [Clostridia bacterium]